MTRSLLNQSPLLSRLFTQWTKASYDHAFWVLGFCMLILVALISQIPKVEFDMSNEAMLHKSDSIRTDYDRFKAEFGREDAIILSLEIPQGISEQTLSNLSGLQNDIENTVPHLKEVTSILNASYTYGENDDMFVEDLLEGYPNHKWDLQELNTYLINHPTYKNRLISADGKHLVLLVDLQTYDTTKEDTHLLNDKQSAQAVDSLRNIIEKHSELKIRMTGEPVLLETINYLTSRDTALTAVIAVFVIIFLLLYFLRRRSGLFIPLLVMGGSMTGSIGVMGLTGSPYTLISTTTYALIIGMSIADSLHILTIFYKHYENSGDKREAIIYAMSHSAPAVTLTTVTTAIGFLSFITGDLASTSQLGVSAAAAVFFALFFTITLTPSLLSIFNITQQAKTQSVNTYLVNFLIACANLSTTYPKSISLGSIALFIACIYGTTFLGFSHNPITNFPDDTLAKIENIEIDEIYQGYTPIEIIIDTGKQGGIYNENFIKQLQEAVKQLSHTEFQGISLGASNSIIDVLKESHKALNGNSNDFYFVAEDRETLAQEILLYELNNAEDLFKLIDNNYSKVRLTLFTNHDDGVVYEQLISNIQITLNEIFDNSGGHNVDITITGANALVAGSVPRALRTMIKSYVIASILIVLVMVLMMKSVRIGLISIIPNILPIIFVLNILMLLGIPLDLSTILVGAIAMGIVVDDSLHFLYHFKKYYLESQDVKQAVMKTHISVGPALFMTTIVFAACCGTNIISSIFGVNIFGWSLAAITIFALLADLLIAPALLVFFLPSIKQSLQ